MTVWVNLFQRGGFKAGETLLVHGGASGIGTTATMRKAFGAAKIFTTISSEAQREASLRLGADLAIDYTEQDFVEEVLRGTEGRGVDVIVDIVAGDYVTRNYQAAAMNGRIVQIGVIKGKAAEVDLFPMLSKRLVHLGSTLRSRSHERRDHRRTGAPGLAARARRRCPAASVPHLPLEQARQAHELMDSGQHIGKIVLTSAPRGRSDLDIAQAQRPRHRLGGGRRAETAAGGTQVILHGALGNHKDRRHLRLLLAQGDPLQDRSRSLSACASPADTGPRRRFRAKNRIGQKAWRRRNRHSGPAARRQRHRALQAIAAEHRHLHAIDLAEVADPGRCGRSCARDPPRGSSTRRTARPVRGCAG